MILWISLATFATTLILAISMNYFESYAWRNFMTTLTVFTGLFILALMVSATSWNSTPTPETKTITPGTTDNLMNNEPTYRDCASSDNKIVVVEGSTYDTTLWIPWGSPRGYHSVIACNY